MCISFLVTTFNFMTVDQISIRTSLQRHHQNLIVLLPFSRFTLFLNQPNLTDPVEQWVETPLDAMETG